MTTRTQAVPPLTEEPDMDDVLEKLAEHRSAVLALFDEETP